jgi:predicted Zn-dependent protease
MIAMAKMTHFYKLILMIIPMVVLSACSTNEATGKQQFTAFMPASSEAKIGAEEHDNILKAYGGKTDNAKIQSYVESIGRRLVPYTERGDVQYTFTVLDSPIMNAFALPGGYVYVSRGILMYANDEAELASVIGHEIGHVTARHSAQRYSKSVLASIAGVGLSAAFQSGAINQAFGLGANLYLSAYSRTHEREADSLGIRYIERAGYDPDGSPRFLATMDRYKTFSKKLAGKDNQPDIPNYFSTHPVTAERVADAKAKTATIGKDGDRNKIKYMQMINGMIYGDSPKQGFVTQGMFVHPEIGFKFPVPKGYYTENSPSAFLAVSKKDNGPALLFEGDAKQSSESIEAYARRAIAKGDFSNVKISGVKNINGFNAVTVEKRGRVGRIPANLIMTAIEFKPDLVFVMNLAIPDNVSSSERNMVLSSLNNFSRVTNADKQRYKPKTIQIRAAKAGDTIEALAARLPFDDGLNLDRFRVLNGLDANDTLTVGQLYKTIVN